MKAVVLTLKPKECKAIEAIVTQLKAGRTMMYEGAKLLSDNERMLWDRLNMLYPSISEYKDKKFCYENFEVTYFEPENKKEEYKLLKEKAVQNQDFELAAKYRELERNEIKKDKNGI